MHCCLYTFTCHSSVRCKSVTCALWLVRIRTWVFPSLVLHTNCYTTLAVIESAFAGFACLHIGLENNHSTLDLVFALYLGWSIR